MAWKRSGRGINTRGERREARGERRETVDWRNGSQMEQMEGEGDSVDGGESEARVEPEPCPARSPFPFPFPLALCPSPLRAVGIGFHRRRSESGLDMQRRELLTVDVPNRTLWPLWPLLPSGRATRYRQRGEVPTGSDRGGDRGTNRGTGTRQVNKAMSAMLASLCRGQSGSLLGGGCRTAWMAWALPWYLWALAICSSLTSTVPVPSTEDGIRKYPFVWKKLGVDVGLGLSP